MSHTLIGTRLDFFQFRAGSAQRHVEYSLETLCSITWGRNMGRDPTVINARRFATWLGVSIAAIALSLAPPLARAETRSIDLTILLVNDMDQMSGKDGRGGIARVGGVVRSERANGDNVLLFHAGDALSPSLLSGFDQGAHMIELLNMLDLATFAPGNHEFDFGPDVFVERAAEAAFPILAANLRAPDGTPVAGVDDHLVLDIDGLKLGVVGLVTAQTPILSSAGDLRFTDPLDSLETSASQLRDDGADLIIGLGHLGTGDDQLIQCGVLPTSCCRVTTMS